MAKQTIRKDSKKQKQKELVFRFAVLFLAFIVASVYLGRQLFKLQVEEHSKWAAMAKQRQLSSKTLRPDRGNIYDVNGRLLAQSAAVWTIVASPEVVAKAKLSAEKSSESEAARVAAREFARILGLDEEQQQRMYEKLSEKESKYFKIKGQVEKPIADEVRAVCETYGIPGITLLEDTRRYYPFEEMASSIIGFSNTDGNGVEGLEYQYNDILSGVPGRLITVVDGWGGQTPAGDDSVRYEPQNGNSIVLTLNVDIQKSLEEHLANAVMKYSARERGMGIVMDVNTGAILAMASIPAYNPNDPNQIYNPDKVEQIQSITDPEEKDKQVWLARITQWRNKCLADTYEPGSVFKIITAAAALDSGMYTEHSQFACNSVVDIADRSFHCALDAVHGMPTLRDALIESCNVSFIKMGEGLGAHTWYDYLHAFGLTEPTGVDLPGEPRQMDIDNILYSEQQLGPVELASCSFGQSNKYTPLQMITAVSAAVNGGNLMQPHILHQVLDPGGNVIQEYEPVIKRQVISQETSAILRDIMEGMVSTSEYGRSAFVAGYHVGGKSGTSEKLDVKVQTGRTDAYISSFVGFAPAFNPQIAVLIALDEPIDDHPRATYFGGRIAGPAVGGVIKDAMGILGIEPMYNTEDDLARSTVSCPKVVDEELGRAMVLLDEKKLSYRVIGDGPVVVGQYPQSYTQVPYGGLVILYTNPDEQPQLVEVPDLAGSSARAATETLHALGLNISTTGAPDNQSGVLVASQSIEPGEMVEKGTIILLTMADTTAVGD